MTLDKYLRHVPHFPSEGIDFIDITPILQDAELFERAITEMADLIGDLEFDHIVGVESRGFIFGAPLALRFGRGFIPVRKPGKLPAETHSYRYEKEYGEDELQMHKDALTPGEKVLIIDDLLATGGTAYACQKLVELTGAKVEAHLFFVELMGLNGREMLDPKVKVLSLMEIEQNEI